MRGREIDAILALGITFFALAVKLPAADQFSIYLDESVSISLSFLFIIPLLLRIQPEMAAHSHSWLQPPPLIRLWEIWVEFFGGMLTGGLGLLILIAGTGFSCFIHEVRLTSDMGILLLSGPMTLIVLWLISKFQPVFEIKYLFFLFPLILPCLVGLANNLLNLILKHKAPKHQAPSFLITKNFPKLVLFSGWVLFSRITFVWKPAPKEDWKAAGKLAKKAHSDGYLTIVSPLYQYRSIAYYLNNGILAQTSSPKSSKMSIAPQHTLFQVIIGGLFS